MQWKGRIQASHGSDVGMQLYGCAAACWSACKVTERVQASMTCQPRYRRITELDQANTAVTHRWRNKARLTL
jgi:hypothetical protein